MSVKPAANYYWERRGELGGQKGEVRRAIKDEGYWQRPQLGSAR